MLALDVEIHLLVMPWPDVDIEGWVWWVRSIHSSQEVFLRCYCDTSVQLSSFASLLLCIPSELKFIGMENFGGGAVVKGKMLNANASYISAVWFIFSTYLEVLSGRIPAWTMYFWLFFVWWVIVVFIFLIFLFLCYSMSLFYFWHSFLGNRYVNIYWFEKYSILVSGCGYPFIFLVDRGFKVIWLQR